jgi:ubiquinone/menaquinone biosynthesis C-methylase UbiE
MSIEGESVEPQRHRSLPIRLRRRVARVAGRLLSAAIPRLARRLRIDREETRLRRIWARLPEDVLDRYLVAGYQNPRINVQSIMARHFLISGLFGARFDDLMEEELRFAIEMNETLRLRSLELGVPERDLGEAAKPDRYRAAQRVSEVIADRETRYRDHWRSALATAVPEGRLSVLEFACGSANDYRAFVEFGLAPFLDYVGVDITEKNIANARSRFPDARFEVGSIMGLPYPDGSYDYVLASDIFEHFSLEGLEQALGEAMRLARRGLVFAFFNMTAAPHHVEVPRRNYYWNELSAPRIEAALRERFPIVSVTPVAEWLAERYGYEHSYNERAYTITAEATTT